MSAAREQGRALPARHRAAAAALAFAVVLAPAIISGPALAAPRAVSAPIEISVVVPITLRAGDDGMLGAETLETATSPSGTLTRELDELLATSATIALDPMILASIRVLGSTAPPTALAWLDRLAAAPNEVFLLGYADADLTALARNGSLDLATALDFGFAIDPANFGPELTATPTPTPTPTPTETADAGAGDPPPLPSTEELLAWPAALPAIAWPASGSAAAADLAAYDAAGYEAVLLNSGNLSETGGALADLGEIRGLVADSAASELLREASTSIDDATREQALTRLGAALDGLGAAHPGRSVVLTLDRLSTFKFYGLDEAFGAIEARETTRMVGLSDVLSGPADPASVVDGAAGAHVLATPGLTAVLQAEDLFASILSDPLLLTAPRRLQLLALLSVQEVADPEWQAQADVFLERSAEILGSVEIVDTGSLFVASTSTSIPIRIANALDFAVTVRLDARPLRPLLQIDSPAEVTIEPGSSKTVRLDAQAITNGRVVVDVSLSSPSTGTPIGQSRRFDADLQAQWETVGLIVFAVLAIVFAVGIVRNVVVRRRRAVAERAATEPGGSQETE
ncbi:DUF6049 family protein [Pseudolysinimonas sp.]|uniref:DUF6049 family protein n=1 Tax=Pseudolysinimonas sp. TaxID=2680009 RepID=UPI0037848F67